MNTKSLLVSFVAVTLLASVATAGGFNNRFSPAGAGVVRGGSSGWHGGNWGGGNWNGRWGGDWHHHHHDSDNFVFFGSFGFPFGGFGYPYGYGYYPYGYYPYAGYGYGPGGYYGYGNGYYGGGYYGNSNGYYGSSYYQGSGYRGSGNRSSVAQLQQRLARAGYYRGPIDGIMGPRTRYALRAYQHDRGSGNYTGNY